MSVAKLLTDFPDGITAIDTLYTRRGLAASHLIVHAGRGAFVDTGANSAVPNLLAALAERGLAPEAIDYVLLTHVHLDHAGGAGLLMSSLPNARAVVHPRGARHLADPSRLIAGSIAVYGEEAYRKLYGDLVPIPAERMLIAEDGLEVSLAGRLFELIHTPGHALHHYAVVDTHARAIFTGDSFGISYRDFDTSHGEFIFPTTTPVQFDPQAMHATIERLIGFRPKAMYLTHYSRVNDLARLARDLHRAVDEYVEIARRHHGKPDRGALIRRELKTWFDAALDRHGYTGGDATRRALLETDIELNSQGLEVWLDHSSRSGGHD
jgi:glyoxylase-like metal-dependent hydrolase (beta-lactamase superfamily II)